MKTTHEINNSINNSELSSASSKQSPQKGAFAKKKLSFLSNLPPLDFSFSKKSFDSENSSSSLEGSPEGSPNFSNFSSPSYESSCLIKKLSSPVEVTPYLYIGNFEAGKNFDLLQKHGFKTVINLTTTKTSSPHKDIEVLNWGWNDNESQEIIEDCKKFIELMNASIKKGSPILVHCKEGISRSAALVISYLMQTNNFSFDVALQELRQIHPQAEPNFNFSYQLTIWYQTFSTKEKQKLSL